jgi:hypothetical protein
VDLIESPAGLFGMLQPEVLEGGAIRDAAGVARGDIKHVEIPARIECVPKGGLIRDCPLGGLERGVAKDRVLSFEIEESLEDLLGRLLVEKTGNLVVAVVRVPACGPCVAGPLQVPSDSLPLIIVVRTGPSLLR